jgi:hypothetical protein
MTTPPAALKDAAREAWLWSLPLIEIATTRTRTLGMGQTMNAITHVPVLADHRHRAVTTPNTDTLYSTSQIDLAAGPATFVLPAAGDRYLSLALMDAYSNNFAVLGTRTTGPDGGVFTLVGPTEAAEGPNVVRSPTRHVWALARILVAGPHDLDAARAVQRQISLQAPAAEAPPAMAHRGAPWQDYFRSVSELMIANPPPVTDRAVLARMAPLGLGAGFDPAAFSAGEAAAIEAGVAEGRRAARGGGGLSGEGFIEGWSYPASRLGEFGQDYLLRAAVALGGLAALPLAEATYLRAGAPQGGGLFDGASAWRLHFPADRLIPVDSFWSLSLYEATPDGQYFFTDNPLNRYAIGDRTPGLAYNDDGSLDLWIGHDSPGPDRESNWLPAPAGPFALFMRAYLPRPELLNGRYRLPPVEAA